MQNKDTRSTFTVVAEHVGLQHKKNLMWKSSQGTLTTEASLPKEYLHVRGNQMMIYLRGKQPPSANHYECNVCGYCSNQQSHTARIKGHMALIVVGCAFN